MEQRSRRSVLGAVVTLALGGCLDGSGNDAGDGTELSDDNTTADDGGDTNDQADAGEGGTDDGDDETERPDIDVGDQLYTEWIPVPATTTDGSVEDLAFVFADAAQLRQIEEALPESVTRRIPRENSLPLVQRGPVDQLLRIQVPIREPDYSRLGSTTIFAGEFDREGLVDAYANTDQAEWDDRVTYEGFTIFVFEGSEDGPGESIAVGESAVLFVPQRTRGEQVETVQDVIDAGAGRTQRVHQFDSEIARLYSILDGSTFVGFRYGPTFLNSGSDDTDPPEGLLGAITAHTVIDTEAEIQLVFLFNNRENAEAAYDNDRFPQNDLEEISKSLEGSIVLATRTVPISEYEGFR